MSFPASVSDLALPSVLAYSSVLPLDSVYLLAPASDLVRSSVPLSASARSSLPPLAPDPVHSSAPPLESVYLSLPPSAPDPVHSSTPPSDSVYSSVPPSLSNPACPSALAYLPLLTVPLLPALSPVLLPPLWLPCPCLHIRPDPCRLLPVQYSRLLMMQLLLPQAFLLFSPIQNSILSPFSSAASPSVFYSLLFPLSCFFCFPFTMQKKNGCKVTPCSRTILKMCLPHLLRLPTLRPCVSTGLPIYTKIIPFSSSLVNLFFLEFSHFLTTLEVPAAGT